MPLLVQLLVTVVVATGWGVWVWLLSGRPSAWRNTTWLWCALAGYSLHTLLLQGLVYLDFPLRGTAGWAFGVAVIGVIAWVPAWRRTRSRRRPGRVAEVTALIALVIATATLHGTSIARVGADRFVGGGTIDQLNYVVTAQFLVEEPFSTSRADIKWRPWLFKAIDAKSERLTQCVALGANAVIAGTDAQRAWAASLLWFVGILALAVAGWLRVAAGLPPTRAVFVALWAAATPAVATVLLLGFYSQLCTLWVLPALAAICRAGGLPRRAQIVCAAPILAFYLGAYSELAPLGVAVTAVLIFSSRSTWRERVRTLVLIWIGALGLLAGYLPKLATFLVLQFGNASKADHLAVWATEAGTWRGWGHNFFATQSGWDAAGGAIVALAALATLIGIPFVRRWWLAGALGAPLALFGWLLMQPRLPAYACHKLWLTCAPLVAALAGCLGSGGPRVCPAIRRVIYGGLVFALLGSVVATLQRHRAVVDGVNGLRSQTYEMLWQARERVESQPERFYVITADDAQVGAWLSYFARRSQAAYDPGSISDRRVPSESVVFRRPPAGHGRTWLALGRDGAADDYEALPRIAVHEPRREVPMAAGTLYLLGGETLITMQRELGFAPERRRFFVEFGTSPVAEAGPCRIEWIDTRDGAMQVLDVSGPTLARMEVNLRAGENRFRLRVAPLRAGAAGGARDLLALQSLSVEARTFRFGQAVP